MKINVKKYVPYTFLWCMGLSILYMEIVFAMSLSGVGTGRHLLEILLFSAAYGCVLCAIGSLCRHRIWGKIIRSLLLLLVSVPYLIEYFVCRQFQVLYDLRTIFSGSGDAVREFSGDIFRLILSADGILHLVLFLLPFLGYVSLCRKFDTLPKVSWWQELVLLLLAVLFYLCSLFVIYGEENDRAAYQEEYHYESAARYFGLASALRLDLKSLLFPQETSFDMSTQEVRNDYAQLEQIGNEFPGTEAGQTEAVDVPVTETTEPTETTETVGTESSEENPNEEIRTPEEYGKNELDIDFQKLAEQTSGTLAELDRYVAALPASSKNAYTGLFKGKNLIFFSAEAFTAEVIDPKLTPTLYRLANRGICFTDYYQPDSAGTTGGEYANLMGMLPSAGGSSMKKTADHNNYMTIASFLNREGYYGKAYHNNSYTYYSRNKTHVNLGYSDGFMGMGNGMEAYVTKRWPQSDLEMLQGTLPEYIGKAPFNIYYMTVSGHSDYSLTGNSMSKKNWDRVKDLNYSDKVKCYLAAQLEFEDALNYLVGELEKAGIADDTVICISADHFPYGLDDDSGADKLAYVEELYGYKIHTTMERDHNRLILWSGCLEEKEPIVVAQPTFSPDILPTLCNLFGVAFDARLLPGRDVFSDALPLVYNLSYDWKTNLGSYTAASGRFVPVSDEVEIPKDYVKTIKNIVRNKIKYSKGVLETDYYSHVFAEP